MCSVVWLRNVVVCSVVWAEKCSCVFGSMALRNVVVCSVVWLRNVVACSVVG